ncbi:hypothetical protein BDV93DRAFT_518615 [Ceratobasidium sp. AG-I]|nr:hypothetical protein BDV93DRAFT_518615 [Ceratobasidium sp. AG-I]
MSSLFQKIFGCCLARRIAKASDERTPLVQPPDIIIIDHPPVIQQDSDELREQLFAAHHDAASRMVNVEAAHPFVVLPNHDSSYSISESRSQSRSSSRHFDSESRSASPSRRVVDEEVVESGDAFTVGVAGVRFLRPDVMRGRTGSVDRGRPRLSVRNGSVRGSKENIVPTPGEGLSSYETQITTPTQPIQNPMDALAFKGVSVLRDFPPVHEVMGVGEQDFYD